MKTWDIDDKVDAVYEMRMEQVDHAIRTGGPAAGGLTVRDYFAAKAMQALMKLRNDVFVEESEDGVLFSDDPDDFSDEFELTPYNRSSWCAKDAYEIADAMMLERDKKPQTPCSVEEAFGL